MNMLGSIVAQLHDHDVRSPIVADLGRYGTEPAHYEAVGEALLAALERTLGARYRPEVAQA